MSGYTVGFETVKNVVDTSEYTTIDTGTDTGYRVENNNPEPEEADETDDRQPTSDLDGDDVLVEDGDCNNDDPLIYQSVIDDCHGIDNHWEGTIDGFYEPIDRP